MADRRARRTVLGPGLLLLGAFGPAPAHAQGIGLEDLREMMSWGTGSLILVDKLEVGAGFEDVPVELETVGWVGGAYNRLWMRVEGEQATLDPEGEGELHAYYGRLVTPWWDLLGGVRVDGRWGDGGDARAHLAVGVIGLTPLRFEIAPTLFVSHEGDVSARLEAEYQLLITQRVFVAPEAELNVAVGEAPEWGVADGINDLELGLRVRYEIVRQFGPYVGVNWRGRFMGAADLARARGEPVSEAALVAGLRMWR